MRVSTDKQDLSPAVQEQRIRAWAVMKGLSQCQIFTERQSGKSADDRPVLQSALEAVCAAHGVLVVVKLDRLSRSIKDAAVIAERLSLAGADLVSLTEGLVDTTTANGELVFNFFCMIAQFERRQISERTQAVLDAKRDRGEALGNTPFGFARDNGMLVPLAAEQESLAFILMTYGAYGSYAHTARLANERRIKPRAMPWTAKSVRRRLTGTSGELAEDRAGFSDIAACLNREGVDPPDPRWTAAMVLNLVRSYAGMEGGMDGGEDTPSAGPMEVSGEVASGVHRG